MKNVFGKRSLGHRKNQEDAYKIVMQSEQNSNSDILLLVSDGMGGHIGGEVASNLAISQFSEYFISGSSEPKPRARLRKALHVSNEALSARIAKEPELKGMGCTFLGALKLNDQLVWISVGDSLLYLFRKGHLRRLNADHSLYGELLQMVAEGKISKSEADIHPKRNSLRSAVMGETISLIDINKVSLEPGDILILATDGLDTLRADQISEVIQATRRADAAGITTALLEKVEQAKKTNQDNTTVVVYQHDNGNSSEFHKDSKWRISNNSNKLSTLKIVLLTLAGVVLAMILGLLVYVLAEPEEIIHETPKASTSTNLPQKIGNGEADRTIGVPDTEAGGADQPEIVDPGVDGSSKDKAQPDGEADGQSKIESEGADTSTALQDPEQDPIVDRGFVSE